MATKRPTIPMRIKLKTSTSSMEYDGSIHEGIEMAFCYLTPKRRSELLAKLPEMDAKLTAHEARTPDADK